MKAHYLGHVVFYVQDFERSWTFYRGLLGSQEVGQIFDGRLRRWHRAARITSCC
ncbi:MAG: VOC family protein [Nitrospirota bacterium]|nr:VOC family protein [Nitrospirota bacterium]